MSADPALPSLSGLEAFDAVVRVGSFTRAAASLHISQSAVSHRIRALEQQLGLTLFVRRARHVELTEAGRELSVAVGDGFDRLRDGVRALARRSGSTLTVSCSPSFAIRWLVPRLPDLRAAHPELEVRLAADDRLATPGVAGVDACLRYGAGDYAGVALTRLAEERISPVCAPSLGIHDPGELANEVLLHDEVLRRHPGRIGWHRWLEAAGLEHIDPEAGPRFSHAHMAIEAAIAGQGVTLGRTSLVSRDLRDGRLVRPFELELVSGLSYWLVTPKGDVAEPVAQFRAWLSDTMGA
ncbi:MAG: LysR substrate-binding domain-containing protein [Sandaracinaceae bacterium]